MDKFCEDCIHNEVCQYYAIPPHIGRCNDKDTLDDLIPHGEWVKVNNPDTNTWTGGLKCSECGRGCVQASMYFCSNCGAKMESGAE